jgi:hypothetical protein
MIIHDDNKKTLAVKVSSLACRQAGCATAVLLFY